MNPIVVKQEITYDEGECSSRDTHAQVNNLIKSEPASESLNSE